MKVVYEDRWLWVIDKPVGIPSQGTRRGEAGVYELWSANHPYVGLPHRLDRAASGLLMLVRDPKANPAVARAFRANALHRSYLAAVEGVPEALAWTRPLEGKEAVTRVRSLSSVDGRAALLLSLDTGRTHQIRQHGAMEGHPLLGDRRYGGPAARAWSRLALHAVALSGPHPVTGAPLHLVAPLPDDLSPLFLSLGAAEAMREEGWYTAPKGDAIP